MFDKNEADANSKALMIVFVPQNCSGKQKRVQWSRSCMNNREPRIGVPFLLSKLILLIDEPIVQKVTARRLKVLGPSSPLNAFSTTLTKVEIGPRWRIDSKVKHQSFVGAVLHHQ